ncbi:PC4 and SFRS1-interacting protein-like [Contarinia nasturtii]|uniref:PC4 and SFRS1-interacting protein-like n=1 Tax=Contarinia nasturtii TaxID=265458 RepID=UPI0012D3CE1C|nr:PC4 and SFRS1-interacting protein-like [Contarinia nasturtii]
METVWAKIKYCPFWPARIVSTPLELGKVPKNKICVLFFGTKTFGFVHQDFVCDYVQNRTKYATKGRGSDFKNAVIRMDEFILDPVKFAANGSVKPVNHTIQVKRERAPIVKTENDINNVPFETSFVQCRSKTKNKSELPYNSKNVSDLKAQIEAAKNEKEKLVEELVATKDESQTMYFNFQSSQKMIATLQSERNELKEKCMEQNKVIAQLTKEKNQAQNKIKQLMANTHVKLCEEVESSVDLGRNKEYEVEAILSHSGRKGQRRFLIRWKNYSSNHDSWENESNLNCDEILNKYLHAKGLKK